MLRKSLAILLALTVVSPAVAAEVKLKAAMDGSGGGDADGSGTAAVTIDTDKGQLCYTIEVQGIDPASIAHIHQGAAGARGGPVVSIDAPSTGKSQGCASAGADVLTAIIADPAGYYVNVHNGAHPGGAIRGQLSK